MTLVHTKNYFLSYEKQVYPKKKRKDMTSIAKNIVSDIF